MNIFVSESVTMHNAMHLHTSNKQGRQQHNYH